MARTRTAPAVRLTPDQLREIAYHFAEAAFAGHNPAYNAARADGNDRGLLVFDIDELAWQADGQLALHVNPGFEPIDGVPTLIEPLLHDIDDLMRMLRDYDPRHEVVLIVLTPTQAQSYRIGRGQRAISA